MSAPARPPERDLLQRPLGELLNALASQHELAGGGGPAAAAAAAMAAALTAKVARASRGTWIEAGGAIASAEALRLQAQALIVHDAEAYREASMLLRDAQGGIAPTVIPITRTDRERLAADVLIHAADLALAIAEAANEIGQLAAEVARECPPTLAPDVLTAVMLAEAAASAAAGLVAVNRRLESDDPRRMASRAVAQDAAHARRRACGPPVG